jgi:SAM-dependent methyltransferase
MRAGEASGYPAAGESCLSPRPSLDWASGGKRLDMPEDTITEAFRYTGHEELEQVRLIQRYNRHIADLFLAAVEPGQALLDFGAGIGTISKLVRERARAANILCVEIDANNVVALKREGFDVITDVTQMPPGTVDLVYSSNVLEHIENDVETLGKLYVCLKPGGRAVLWVPAFECLWSGMDDRVEHCRRYTRRTLEEAFRKAGFDIEESFYQDSLGFFFALLFKGIGNRQGKLSPALLMLYDKLVFPLSQLFDVFCSRLFGKNAVIYARKPARPAGLETSPAEAGT